MGKDEVRERVVKELADLQEKITKLEAFLDSDRVKGIGEGNTVLLLWQHSIMKNYEKVLHMRLEMWGK